jgi:hypothetical protein
MPLPSYQVLFLHPVTGAVIKVFDAQQFYAIRYSRVYNSIGAIAVTLPVDNLPDVAYDLTDMFIEVQRTSPITGNLIIEETYLARSWRRYRQGNDERVTIGGVSLNHLLARRVVDPADDPLEAGGYATRAGAADVVLYEYANSQIATLASAPRQMPGLTVPGVLGVAPAIGLRLQYENLFQVFQQACQQAGIDFQISRTNGINMELNIGYLTVDRTQTSNYPTQPFVLLTPERGNLSNPSFSRDRTDEKNFVYMQGKGQGTNRYLIQWQDSTTTSASPFNRIEYAADARNVEKGDSLGILTEAIDALKETQQVIKFEFDPEGIEPGNVYRQNWDVGDLVSAAWGDIFNDLRILSVEINVSEAGENLSIITQVL